MSTAKSSGWKSVFAKHETILLLVLLAEVVFFNSVGRNFGTADNIANIVRQSVEIGLLALVMTPIILTAGIDLSVGSLMGLCAVVFGMLWKDAGVAPWLAAVGAIITGVIGGGVNAALITRLGLPPLIVTLGTFSLFRGLAEAFTGGTKAYTNFPESFRALGNGYLDVYLQGGLSFPLFVIRKSDGLPLPGMESANLAIPIQLLVFAPVAVAIFFLVHRTTFGRVFRAIGFSPEGARYAGIPVERRLAFAYVLAGAVAGLAAVIFASRVAEARANAGIGYELAAITAVVLGGTSIFGGAGTVHGTLLGVAAVAVLANGLTRILHIKFIADHARELSGMLTGALLLLALAAGALGNWISSRRAKS